MEIKFYALIQVFARGEWGSEEWLAVDYVKDNLEYQRDNEYSHDDDEEYKICEITFDEYVEALKSGYLGYDVVEELKNLAIYLMNKEE
jgi:hypothetical protein